MTPEITPSQDEIRKSLVQLYQVMYEHTKDRCDGCRGPASCCHPSICESVIQEAWFKWGLMLQATGEHPWLPLMGCDGCSVAPHLRPLCTVHSCCIQSVGGDPSDPLWTERYWELRNELSDLEWQLLSLR